ncbi:hypothetical protein CERZMDRAFT_94255 [Cercospora zeae-maydis SCOH1-5]|uniref:C3H1-type domain-containing protein n=1 Tax=Cercospora zeae-maydis SCOH1-5 TaxID=717836 RepID=A0A6A6FQY1_9PEZI|nr:hypothetical protein CERZMDRAFT_94255 [Cercospora zeae-maydis SCOH1-5]
MAAQPYAPMPGSLPVPGYPQRSTANDQSQPRLTFFISRPNGFAIPLIPADELPFSIKLQNVPRVLNPQDTYGMQYVGTTPYAGTTFKLESAVGPADLQRSNSTPTSVPNHIRSQSATGGKHYLAPDALARQAFANNAQAVGTGLDSNAVRPPSAHETAKSWRRSEPMSSTDATQNVIDAILRSKSGAETAERVGYRSRDTTPPPSGIVPDQDKKVFCTHWIMTGDCKFVQQGCRYKHEMPSEASLKELGIRHTPRWWLEQNATIKLGGARNVAGPVLKPLEMLRKGGGADSESSSDDSDESDSEVDVPHANKKVPLKLKDYDVKPIARKPIVKTNKSPIDPPIRPSSPATGEPNESRKQSTASDLIDFAPLLPSSAAANTSRVATTSRPKRGYSLRGDPATALTTTSIGTPQTPSTPAKKPTKVFVPAGESLEHHIADMKKRERSARQKRHASRDPSPTNPRALTTSNKRISPSPSPSPSSSSSSSNNKSALTGLQASVHAPRPPASLSSDSNKSSLPSARRNKAGSRIRRPTTSSPVATRSAPASLPPAAVVTAATVNAGAGAGAEKREE